MNPEKHAHIFDEEPCLPKSVGFCRGWRVRCRGSRVKKKFCEVYIKILSNNRLRLTRCLLYGKQENSFHETVLY